MACTIIRDKETQRITQILTEQGMPSLLYRAAYDILQDQDKALAAWASAYTDSFKMKYGDWEKGETSITLDDNGEPTIDIVMHLPQGINNIIKTQFANWKDFQPGSEGWVSQGRVFKYIASFRKKYPDVGIDYIMNPAFPGMAKVVYRPTVKSLRTKYSATEIKEQKIPVNQVMDYLMTKFPGLSYQWVKPESLKQEDHYQNIGSVRAFVKDNQIFLVEGRVIPGHGIEEVAHVFIEMLRQNRPQLFKGMSDALMEDPLFEADLINISNWYAKNKSLADRDKIIRSELLAKALAIELKKELENPERPSTPFGKLVKRFLDWLQDLFGMTPGDAKGTLKDIAAFINSEGIEIDLPTEPYLYYSSDPEANMDPDDMDEQLKMDPTNKFKTNRELNIEKSKESIEKLKLVRKLVAGKPLLSAQLNVIDNLIRGVEEQLAALESGDDFVSVSKYMGSQDSEKSESNAARIGANTGNFFHYLLEEIQMEFAKNQTAPSITVTREGFFEDFYQKNKHLLEYKDLDVNMVKNMAIRMASFVDNLVAEGNIILPEIELGVKDVDGKLVIGRMDLLAVDTKGNVQVVDLKTKRVDIISSANPLIQYRIPYPFDGTYKEGVDPAFAVFKTKSDIDKYHMQVAIYNEMLRRTGVNVTAPVIFALSYSYVGNNEKIADSTEFRLTGYGATVISDKEFYLYDKMGKLGERGQIGVDIDNAAMSRFREPEQIEEEETPTETKLNPFALLTKQDQDKMVERLQRLINEQLESIDKERKKTEQNEDMPIEDRNALLNRLTKRMEGLMSVKSKIDLGFTAETEEAVALAKASVIKLALDVFANEVQTIKSKIELLDIPSTYEIGNLQNNHVLRELQENAQVLNNLGSYIELFRNTVLGIESLDKEAKDNISKYLNDFMGEISDISATYTNMGKKVMKAVILKTIRPEKFEKVMGDMRKMLLPKLNWINKTITKIESGEASPDNWTFNVMKYVSGLLGGKENKKDRLTALKEEAAKIEKLLRKTTLDEETLEEYITGIVDNPDSVFQMGHTISGNDSIISLDQIIGDNANSEMAISGLFQYMRNITEEGRIEFLDWAYENDIDAVKESFIQYAGGINAANDLVTEEVEIHKEWDDEGNVTRKEVHRQYVNPVTVDFYNTENRYLFMLRRYNERIRETNKAIRETPAGPEKDQLENLKAELRDKESAMSLEYVNWMIENTETQVKPEILLLMRGSGVYNAEITDIYDQIHKTILDAGGVEKLTDEQQEKIDNLEAEVSRIKQELLEQRPDLEENMTKLIDNFDFDPNFNLWIKLREQIIKNGNQAELKRWDMNNSEMAPTERYEKRLELIYEALSRYENNDPVMNDLYDERRKIRARNKVRGKFDMLKMTDKEVERYQQIEDEIAKRRLELKDLPSTLTPEQIQERNELYGTLASMQQKVPSEIYTRERDRLKAKVLNAYSLVREIEKKMKESPSAELSRQYSDANNQYLRFEDEFATFFNRNNKTTYELGKNLLAERKDIKEQPKDFVMVYRPVNPNDMELVPGKKYRIRRLKDSAYNPNYEASFVKKASAKGMHSMPKGMKFNRTTNEYDVQPNAPYLNPKYQKIKADSKTREFYRKWIMENFILKQNKASGQPLGYNLPFVKQLGLENVMSKGVEGLGREFKEKMQEVAYKESEFERATNESGMTGTQKIKFAENTMMPANLTTTNGIEAIVNWNSGYYLNRKLAMSAVEMSAILDFLKSIKNKLTDSPEKTKKIDTIINQFDFNRKKFIYGQTYEREKNPMKFLNRKTARTIMQLASFGRMAFDIPMQFGNMLSGNVQTFLSTAKTRHADDRDYLAAKKLIYTRWFPNMLKDWGKISDVSMETKIFRYMNPNAKDLNRIMDANSANKMRRLANRIFNITDLSMALQDKGELEIGLTTMLMIMNHRRYEVFETDANGDVVVENGVKKIKKDADGNTVYVNAIDAFTSYGNKIGLRKDVNITDEEMSSLKGTIMTEIYRFQGNYSAYTKTRFGSTLLGSLYEYYRKYLIPAVSTRFSIGGFEGVGSAYSWDSEEAYTGWYVALGRMFKYYGFGKTSKALLYDTFLPGFVKRAMPLTDSELSDEGAEYYRSRAGMAAREILFALAFYMLYQALRDMLRDSDDDELSYAELMTIRSLVKVTNESRSLVPLPIIGKPADYIDQFGQFTTALREGETLWNLSENALWYVDYSLTGSEHAYERGFYQRDAGRFEEGDAKIMKNLNDLLSISNIQDVIDPQLAAKKAVVNK